MKEIDEITNPLTDYKVWLGVLFFALLFGYLYITDKKHEENKSSMTENYTPKAIKEYMAIDRAITFEDIKEQTHPGQVVVLDSNKIELHSAQYERNHLPIEMLSSSPKTAQTLVVIRLIEEQVSSYSGGLTRDDGSTTSSVPIYKIDLEVKIIDLETKRLIAGKIFKGAGSETFPPNADVIEHKAIHRIEVIGEDKKAVPVSILRGASGNPYGISSLSTDTDNYFKALEFVSGKWNKIREH